MAKLNLLTAIDPGISLKNADDAILAHPTSEVRQLCTTSIMKSLAWKERAIDPISEPSTKD